MPNKSVKILLTLLFIIILQNLLKSQTAINCDCKDSVTFVYENVICDTCKVDETIVFLHYGFEGNYELFLNEQKIYEGHLKTNQSTSIAYSTLITPQKGNKFCIKSAEGCVTINLNENYKTIIISWFPKFWEVKYKLNQINFE